MKLVKELEGYKTYIVAVVLICLGIYLKNAELIGLGCGLAGLRNGITTEVKKLALSSNVVAVAEADAPVIAEAVVEQIQPIVEPTLPTEVPTETAVSQPEIPVV